MMRNPKRFSKRVLVGVFTGYSAVSIAMALPEDGHVIACDITDEYINIGKPLWKEVSDHDTMYFCCC